MVSSTTYGPGKPPAELQQETFGIGTASEGRVLMLPPEVPESAIAASAECDTPKTVADGFPIADADGVAIFS